MKAIVKARPEPGGLELWDVPVPKPGPDEVLIKMKRLAICGTDHHIYKWDAWSQSRVQVPRIIGHEFAGVVVEVGSHVKHVKVGDYVSGEGHITCGFCRNCRTGKAHVCENFVGIGYDVDGAFAEYMTLPESNVVINDPDLDPDLAALQDPLGNAVHTVFAADCVANSVAVFGAGPVGLLIIAVLKHIGASHIIVVEWDNEYRLDLARKLGATHTIKAAEEDAVSRILDITGGRGVEVSLEAAGAVKSINDAMKATAPGGNVVLLGIPNGEVPLDITGDIVFKGLTLHGITGRRMFDTWYRMQGLFRSGLDIRPVITHKFKFEDYEKGFEAMASGKCGKVILTLDE